MKILVCGSRKNNKSYRESYQKQVDEILDEELKNGGQFELIEGCCPNSADEFAEIWAKKHNIKIHHFPSHAGNYLKRNIEMVQLADKVIAVWDGFSYGTSHTVAHGLSKGIPVDIFDMKGLKNGIPA